MLKTKYKNVTGLDKSPEFIERFGLDIRAGKLEGQKPFNTLIDAEGGSSGIIGNTSSINLVELKQLTDAAATTAAATSAPGTAPIAMIDSGSGSYPEGNLLIKVLLQQY